MRRTARLTQVLCIGSLGILSIVPARPQDSPPATPPVSISPTKVDFGTATAGEAGTPQVVTINNPGTLPVAINLLIAGIDFTQTTDCGDSLAAGASCTVQITFKPATTGPRLGTLIVDTSRGNLGRVTLSGVGK